MKTIDIFVVMYALWSDSDHMEADDKAFTSRGAAEARVPEIEEEEGQPIERWYIAEMDLQVPA